MTEQQDLREINARLFGENEQLKRQVNDKQLEVEHCNACCDELREMLTLAKKERDQQAQLAAMQFKALSDLLDAIGGGKKFCGHEFECICAGDQARQAVTAFRQTEAVSA